MPPIEGRFALAAWIEGLTLITLMLIVPQLEAWTGIEAISSFLGPLHGVAFLWWLSVLIETSVAGRLWGWWVPVGVIAANIPLGTIVFHYVVARHWKGAPA